MRRDSARPHAPDGEGAPGLATLAGASSIEVFIDVLRPPNFSIVLFGAGHVGRALVRTFADLDCRITWVDARDDAFPASVPDNVEVAITDAPEAEVAAAPPGAYFLVMTHSHPLDEALCECILRRGDFAYFGLIGSLSKRRQFEKRLEARGVTKDRLATMTCPIGIEGRHRQGARGDRDRGRRGSFALAQRRPGSARRARGDGHDKRAALRVIARRRHNRNGRRVPWGNP
jgi:xanthine/CO dehydrogenase XdhC/CoxF family maturation factor